MLMENVLPINDKVFVGNLIPQKFPFVMVDKLLSFSENEVIAGLTVTEDNIFVSGDLFQESGVIEHMAQSVALYTGYQFYLKNEQAPTGYIGSIKSIEITTLPKLGDTLVTTVNVLHEFMGVTLVDIVTKVNDNEIARGQMKTVLAS
ncbi:FabZ [Flavobacterium enshiense DK69]|uniref:FabZ n=2 Tax=Flavobacterium TaxID=237 RepID=A0A0A2MUT8_9FLAO|nr:FabZ [Flavobacterium enshiense DK69]